MSFTSSISQISYMRSSLPITQRSGVIVHKLWINNSQKPEHFAYLTDQISCLFGLLYIKTSFCDTASSSHPRQICSVSKL